MLGCLGPRARSSAMRSWIKGAWVLAAGFAVAIGCGSSDAPAPVPGSACTLNSDCNNPLSCAFGKCHQSCKESRDCPQPARCVKLDLGTVCQLPTEIVCGGNVTCESGQVCGSNNGCVATCTVTNDCVVGQSCAVDAKGSNKMICAEAKEVGADGTVMLDPVGDASTPGAGGSGGSGGGASGASGAGGASGGSAGTGGASGASSMSADSG